MHVRPVADRLRRLRADVLRHSSPCSCSGGRGPVRTRTRPPTSSVARRRPDADPGRRPWCQRFPSRRPSRRGRRRRAARRRARRDRGGRARRLPAGLGLAVSPPIAPARRGTGAAQRGTADRRARRGRVGRAAHPAWHRHVDHECGSGLGRPGLAAPRHHRRGAGPGWTQEPAHDPPPTRIADPSGVPTGSLGGPCSTPSSRRTTSGAPSPTS